LPKNVSSLRRRRRGRAWHDLKKRAGPGGYICPLAENAEPPVAALG